MKMNLCINFLIFNEKKNAGKLQSPEQNKELNRRIAVHIVTVCEELFNHYTKKAQGL